MTGEAALVSGTMRFLSVLLVDRALTSAWDCDLPSVVLRGLFPGQRWLQLRYDLSPWQAFWRQVAYPPQALARGVGALLRVVIRNSLFVIRYSPFVIRSFSILHPQTCDTMKVSATQVYAFTLLGL